MWVSMAMHFPPSDAALFHGLLNFVSTKIARKLLSLLLSLSREVSFLLPTTRPGTSSQTELLKDLFEVRKQN